MKKLLTPILIQSLFLVIMLVSILLLLIILQVDYLSWTLLIAPSFGRLPLIIIVFLITILFGLTLALIHYFQVKKEFNIVSDALDQVRAGQVEEKLHYYGEIIETNQLIQLINGLQGQLINVKKRMQKVMSERIEDQEEKIEARLTEERNRLARELHDSVSQELFAASMLVSAINEMPEKNEALLRRPLEQIERMIQQAQLEMRALLLHLRPIALKNHSIQQGIEQLLQELVNKVPISIDWSTEDIKLNRAVEDHLFRILQECLSNALRHAKANQIDVLFIERDGVAVLSVVDDGIGFDSEAEQSGSYGLANMRERAEEIDAQYQLVSVLNQGTKLDVRVPIKSSKG
ncbi:two-component system, NarL family, sensor histidine kinase LiaS [Amphibacillus marinus]|uniref:Sensor histidine kinase n=1 Tax=Amphibacillus marinus TaxID=872970 RepID=A0A1H8MWY6_9BACI|nr:sensor histidine kinase [Amphibacillus marinus]SEO21790.1 two-component system, NarL family, sensor histidine kinase LiaS [Amphibacillus marinus]